MIYSIKWIKINVNCSFNAFIDRKEDEYRKRKLEDEIEEDRLRRERLDLQSRYNWELSDRKRRLLDHDERSERAMKHFWHNVDEDKYNYKRYRKPRETVEAWWLDPYPYAPSYRKWWDHKDFNADWWKKKYWTHPSWWETRDPYGPPPGKFDKDWWWYGSQEQPWKKEKGYWQNGRWVPLDVAAQV